MIGEIAKESLLSGCAGRRPSLVFSLRIGSFQRLVVREETSGSEEARRSPQGFAGVGVVCLFSSDPRHLACFSVFCNWSAGFFCLLGQDGFLERVDQEVVSPLS